MADSANIAALAAKLPALISASGHSEIYGIDLSSQPLSDPSKLILGKYLRAHNNDVEQASKALEATLKWRKEFNPRKAAFEEKHDAKFDEFGYITKLGEDVCTWNVYGAAASNPKALFEPLDDFLRWRVGLMERTVEALNIKDYVGDGTADPKRAIQVHDYLSVSFFRMDPAAKKGSQATIDLMTKHYPETMRRKFFVNVPVIMGWMFSAMRLVLSKATIDKFTVLSYGEALANPENLGHKAEIPRAYGGTSVKSLKDIATELSVSKAVHPVEIP